jgi:hypothetical protein
MDYDYEGEGLIKNKKDEVPFSSNPLDSLNRTAGQDR